MTTPTIARQRLDERLRLPTIRGISRPHRGWIRAVRDALGMSSTELAARLGVSQQSVVDLERSEERHTIKLESLERAARALECELVYVLVPRASLDDIVHERATERARRLLDEVGHHSRLEDQAVTGDDLEAQVAEIAARLVDRRGLWTDHVDTRR